MIRENLSKIGYLSKPHGINGELVLRLNGNFADLIEPGESLFVETNGTLVPFFIQEITPIENKAIIKLEFIRSEFEANALCGKQVFGSVNSSEFSEEKAALFIKWLFIDENTGKKGEITGISESDINPAFLVNYEGKECLIPISSDFILRSDDRKKILYLDLPEGLLDL